MRRGPEGKPCHRVHALRRGKLCQARALREHAICKSEEPCRPPNLGLQTSGTPSNAFLFPEVSRSVVCVRAEAPPTKNETHAFPGHAGPPAASPPASALCSLPAPSPSLPYMPCTSESVPWLPPHAPTLPLDPTGPRSRPARWAPCALS